VGYVAKEITKHGGIAICALVAPYKRARDMTREMIAEVGGFIEVYVSTPLSVCETRDRKGLYKKAREGLVKQFTGVSGPYEVPAAAEIEIDTATTGPAEVIETMVKKIKLLGYL
jgi:sulfate adenylyltransferase